MLSAIKKKGFVILVSELIEPTGKKLILDTAIFNVFNFLGNILDPKERLQEWKRKYFSNKM